MPWPRGVGISDDRRVGERVAVVQDLGLLGLVVDSSTAATGAAAGSATVVVRADLQRRGDLLALPGRAHAAGQDRGGRQPREQGEHCQLCALAHQPPDPLTWCSVAPAAGGGSGGSATSAVPHAEQNCAPSWNGVPQPGQAPAGANDVSPRRSASSTASSSASTRCSSAALRVSTSSLYVIADGHLVERAAEVGLQQREALGEPLALGEQLAVAIVRRRGRGSLAARARDRLGGRHEPRGRSRRAGGAGDRSNGSRDHDLVGQVALGLHVLLAFGLVDLLDGVLALVQLLAGDLGALELARVAGRARGQHARAVAGALAAARPSCPWRRGLLGGRRRRLAVGGRRRRGATDGAGDVDDRRALRLQRVDDAARRSAPGCARRARRARRPAGSGRARACAQLAAAPRCGGGGDRRADPRAAGGLGEVARGRVVGMRGAASRTPRSSAGVGSSGAWHWSQASQGASRGGGGRRVGAIWVIGSSSLEDRGKDMDLGLRRVARADERHGDRRLAVAAELGDRGAPGRDVAVAGPRHRIDRQVDLRDVGAVAHAHACRRPSVAGLQGAAATMRGCAGTVEGTPTRA